MPPAPTPMTLTRLSKLIDAYGAEPARWPADERRAAELLLQRDPRAAGLLVEAARLDAWLDSYEVAELAPRVRARVLEVPALAVRTHRRFRLRVAWAAAFSCLLGVVSGAWSAPEASADDEEWNELTQVSFYAGLDAEGEEDAP